MSESLDALQFREALPQEIGGIALVLARANAERDGQLLPTSVEPLQTREMQARWDKHGPDAWLYVATDDQNVVGFDFGYPSFGEGQADTTPDTDYLSLLMVEPKYWGRRIASRLLDIVANQARESGRRHITLWTREADNAHARDVYQHKGFVLTNLARDSQYGCQVQYQLDL